MILDLWCIAAETFMRRLQARNFILNKLLERGFTNKFYRIDMLRDWGSEDFEERREA